MIAESFMLTKRRSNGVVVLTQLGKERYDYFLFTSSTTINGHDATESAKSQQKPVNVKLKRDNAKV